MTLLRQIASFAGVGCCATLAHVLVAFSLMTLSPFDPYICNLLGATSAYGVSFLGNARLTFGVHERLSVYAVRYLPVSCLSLVLTTAELAIVSHFGWPSAVYAIVVLLTVPPATFLLAKLWVFAPAAARTG